MKYEPISTIYNYCVVLRPDISLAMSIEPLSLNLAMVGLLPARASEQGNVIGSVRICVYIGQI